MENEVGGGGGGLCFLFRFSRRVEEGSSIFVALWLLQNSGGPCALICIGRSFPRLPLAPMRINRLPLTSPFRRRAVSPPRNRLLRIQHSPFIGGYGGCCRQQTDIKVIKGRRIPRRERLIAFLGPGRPLPPPWIFHCSLLEISVFEARPCFIAIQTIGRFNPFVANA